MNNDLDLNHLFNINTIISLPLDYHFVHVLLFQPKIVHSPCVLDEWTSYELFDRVVNIRPGFTVPLGLRGTLVGVEPGQYSLFEG